MLDGSWIPAGVEVVIEVDVGRDADSNPVEQLDMKQAFQADLVSASPSPTRGD